MRRPLVLSIAGHDPTGGAGIQADIEAIGACGGRALSVVTCLTIQDTRTVFRCMPMDAASITQSLQRLFADLPVAAVKLGLTGSVEIARAIAGILATHPDIPVVLDPVLASGDGTPLADLALREALLDHLFPCLTLATPNSLEARTLSGEQDLARCAERLLARGAEALLITGGHEPGESIVNRLFTREGACVEHISPRIDREFHGTGCTLSAAIATGLALHRPIEDAVETALTYTLQTLAHADQPGHGQALPDRWFNCLPWPQR